MDNILLQVVLLVIWIGAGAYGVYRLQQRGYKLRLMALLAFYIVPGLAVLHVILDQVIALNAPWPSNLPASVVNTLLVVGLILVSPALLMASFFYPNVNADITTILLRRESFLKIRGWITTAGLAIIVLLLPWLALYVFQAAPRYDGVVGVIINGLLSGSLFALISLGYTLVYGIVELINFAHGDVFMIGSFTGFTIINLFITVKPGQPVPKDTSIIWILFVILIAILVAMVVCATLNYAINRIAYKPLRNAPRVAPLISAIGVSFVLQSLGLYLNSSSGKAYPLLFPNDTRTSNLDVVGDFLGQDKSLIQFPVTGVLVIVVTAILLLGLRFLINRTRTGKAMRAVAQNREAAALMGISIERTISLAFIVGGGLAGAAGTIFGIYIVSDAVKYDLGFVYGLFAFTAAVLGGIGNINGAVLGGYFIGIVYAVTQSSFFGLTSDYLRLSVWAPISVFVVLVMVMIFRPTGLLGDNTQEKV